MHVSTTDDQPLPGGLDSFDPNSGSLLERLVFNNRRAVIVLCALITLVLGLRAATRLTLNASFERMLPLSHPYIQNYLENRNDLRGLGNSLRIVVENPSGDIYDARYQEALRKINDELVLTPGVDRAWVKSLWSPAVRWTEVTEEGFRGGPVMPDNYDGSPQSTERLRGNIARAGITGSLVGSNFKSSMIVVPLLDKDPTTGQRIDYRLLSQQIENIRAKYEQAAQGQAPAVKMHVIGFAKLVGDLIEGLFRVALYFAFAAAVAAAIIYYYTRCVRSTLLVIACSLVAVLWQLGLVAAFGFEIDPYSILVPFLVFAIGVSHGAQKMNGIMQDIARGAHKLVAARYTFRRLFLAGLTALLADAVGFAVLMVIDIPVIKDLALTASVGVAGLILTNLILLPVLLSYVGVSPAAAARSLRGNDMAPRGLNRIWGLLERFTERRWATAAVLASALMLAFGVYAGHHLKIGDLDAGAPELRASSRYNQDNAYITANYSLSSDQFAVIVKTEKEGHREAQQAQREAAQRQQENAQRRAAEEARERQQQQQENSRRQAEEANRRSQAEAAQRRQQEESSRRQQDESKNKKGR